MRKILRPRRHAILLDVGRRRASDAEARPEPLRHEPRIRQLAADDDRDVVTFVEQVRHPLREGQVDMHVRIALAVARHGGHRILLTQTRETMHLQLARRAGMRVARLGLGLVDVREDLLAALQVALPRLGQRDPARRPIQQARAQVSLEIRHGPRSISRRRVQLLCGCRKAPRVDHADEHTHVL